MLRHERPPEKKESGVAALFGKVLRKVAGCDVAVSFKNKEETSRVRIDDPYDRTSELMYLFRHDEPIEGTVTLSSQGSFKHLGVVVSLTGFVTTLTDKEDKVEFMQQEKRFEAGTVPHQQTLDFAFGENKFYESYRGINAKVSYFIRVTVQQQVKNLVERQEVWISKMDEELVKAQPNSSLQRGYFRETEFGPKSVSMEVGVDNVLHIEFKYDKKIFHLHERILGMVTFKVMDLDLQYGEVGIVRKEFIGNGHPRDALETETLQKFEIMDGTPVVGEVVPIRLYLNSIPRLTPTYPNVHNLFRVLYFVNLVLVTGEGKRYFKQQEINLYRGEGQDIPANMQQN